MPLSRIIPAFATTVLLGGHVAYAAISDESEFLDLRLGIGIQPGISTLKQDGSDSAGNTGVETSTLSVQVGVLGTVGAVYGQYFSRHWGVIFGASIFGGTTKGNGGQQGTATFTQPGGNTFNLSAPNDDYAATSGGIELSAGCAFRFNDQFHLEAAPFIGIGAVTITDVHGNADKSNASGTGTIIQYGARISGIFSINHLQFGIYAGYLGSQGKATISYNSDYAGDPNSNAKTKVTANSNGVVAGIIAGYHF